jgi:hypothetical protein
MRQKHARRSPRESSGPGSLGRFPQAPPPQETEPHPPVDGAGDHEAGEARAWWGAWIDLGGEG